MNKQPIKSAIAAKSYGHSGRHLTLAAAFLNNTAYGACEPPRPKLNPGRYASPADPRTLAELLAQCLPEVAKSGLLKAMERWLESRTATRHDLCPETIPARFRAVHEPEAMAA